MEIERERQTERDSRTRVLRQRGEIEGLIIWFCIPVVLSNQIG